MRKTTRLCQLLSLLLLVLSPTLATAQSEVRGSGVYFLDNAADGVLYLGHVAVNAYLDESGAASGWITWQGDYYFELPGPGDYAGGPAYPYVIAVTDVEFHAPGTVPGLPADGPVAVVGGIVVSSPVHEDEGGYSQFVFQDNTDEPDRANAAPIIGGNIIIR